MARCVTSTIIYLHEIRYNTRDIPSKAWTGKSNKSVTPNFRQIKGKKETTILYAGSQNGWVPKVFIFGSQEYLRIQLVGSFLKVGFKTNYYRIYCLIEVMRWIEHPIIVASLKFHPEIKVKNG